MILNIAIRIYPAPLYTIERGLGVQGLLVIDGKTIIDDWFDTEKQAETICVAKLIEFLKEKK